MQDTNGPSVNVAIVGVSGYTGAELIRLLSNHPLVNVSVATSRTHSGKTVSQVFPSLSDTRFSSLKISSFDLKIFKDVDVVFVCLPHGASFEVVKEIFYKTSVKKIIDLSADFRFASLKVYERVYGTKHGAAELLKEACYGLPEIFEREIKKKRIIANPGCYPTSVILPLYPIRDLILDGVPVIVDSKSGVSGAGRKEKTNLLFCEVEENFYAYGLPFHRHEAEMEQILKLPIKFVPHLLPIRRGILSTIYIRASERDIKERIRDFYKDSNFVEIVETPPSISQVRGTNRAKIFVTSKGEITVIVSAIDNLTKGASGQAIQNMNITLGLKETLGLELDPLYP